MKLQSLVFGQQGVEIAPAIFVGGIEGGQVNGNQLSVVLFDQQVNGGVERIIADRFRQVIHHALLVFDAQFAKETGEDILVLLEQPATDQVAGVLLRSGTGEHLHETLVPAFLGLASDEHRTHLLRLGHGGDKCAVHLAVVSLCVFEDPVRHLGRHESDQLVEG